MTDGPERVLHRYSPYVNPEAVRLNIPLTAEHIKDQTDFELFASFKGFSTDNGYVSPDLHEERERLSAEFGESNVLSSLFMDEKGFLQLGLFVRTTNPQV